MKTQWTALGSLFAALLMVACGGGGSSEKKPAESNWPNDAEGPAGTGGGVRVFGGAAGTLSSARSCTHEPGADGDRWCAFIGRSSEGDHNLFVVNVSQVKAGVPVACGTEDPNCLLLTDHVEGSSADFHPSFFQGDTLVYYDRDLAAYAWRPGMTGGRLLARRNTERDIAYCTPAPRGLAVACLSMPSEQPEGAVVVAELLAASVAWEEEPLLQPIADVIAATGDDNVTVHRFGFAALADGYVGWSARETETGPEILKLQRVGDPDSQITVATDIHHWAVTEDGGSWLWMARTSDGSVGTLQIAPFPNGAEPVDLLGGVIDYKLTSNGAVVAETEQHTAVSIVDPNGAPERHVLLGDEIGKISALSDEGQVAFAKRPIGSQFTDFIEPRRYSVLRAREHRQCFIERDPLRTGRGRRAVGCALEHRQVRRVSLAPRRLQDRAGLARYRRDGMGRQRPRRVHRRLRSRHRFRLAALSEGRPRRRAPPGPAVADRRARRYLRDVGR
jgi:hypothetical protein